MRGLDPRSPSILTQKILSKKMDCRVKPGNDGVLYRPRSLSSMSDEANPSAGVPIEA